MSLPREPLTTRARWSLWMASRAPLEGRFPYKPIEAIEEAQRRRLREAIDRAYRHVPYYGETMRRLGLRPGDFRTAGDLAKLPIIEREQLQRDPEYFVARDHPLDGYLRTRSGGTTGTPVTVFRHPFSLFAGAVHRERLRRVVLQLSGKRLRLRQALVILPGSAQSHHAFNSRTLVPSAVRVTRRIYSLLTPPAQLVPRLNEFRPDEIGTYGSYLEALFTHLHRTGERFHRPKVAAFSSDGLTPAARRLISGEFGIHVLGAYQTIEGGQIGFECERHRGYHLNIDLCPIRIVDGQGATLPDGEQGEVVISKLFTRGTVLLNYRLGDLAARLPGSCDCGRTLPLLSAVQGRSHEWLVLPSGEPIHGQAIRDLMRMTDEVLRYQVVQESPERFRAAVVTSARCDRPELSRWIEQRFAERFGSSTRVEVSFVDELPRTPGGKVQPVIGISGDLSVSAEGGP